MSDFRRDDKGKGQPTSSTVARMAGNIAGSIAGSPVASTMTHDQIAAIAVDIARKIVAEVERTEPDPPAPLRSSPTGEPPGVY